MSFVDVRKLSRKSSISLTSWKGKQFKQNFRTRDADVRRLSRKSSSASMSRIEGLMRKTSRTLHVPDNPNAAERSNFEGRIDPDEPLPATQYVSWLVDQPVALHMAKHGPLAQKPITMMTVLKDAVNRHPNKLAYASRVDGKWVKVTYVKFHELVLQAAQGFIKLGLQRFNGVGILGHNATEYLVVLFGVIFAGGVSVLLHINTSDEFSFGLVKKARCRFIVVDSIVERKQVLEWRKKLTHLKVIIQYGKDKLGKSKAKDIYGWQQFLKVGSGVAPAELTTRILQQGPNLCCCILQTAGCSGKPKNVMLSHDNLVWGGNAIGRYMSLSDGSGVMVNFMPLSTIFGLGVSVNIAIRFGTSVYLLPSTKNKALVMQTLRKIRPTIFFAPSVFYEFLHRQLEEKIRTSSALTRVFTRMAMKRGRLAFDDKTRLENPPTCWTLAYNFLFRRVRRDLGLQACDELFSAGGFMMETDFEFLLSLDMPILTTYGTTESAGWHACCLNERFRIDSVGVGLDGCKAKIANPDANGVGELYISGRNLAMGYLESEELTMQHFTTSGTFKTGDLAHMDAEGFIYIVGRKSDFVTLSSGEKISAIPITRSILSNLPFLSYAVVVGEGKPYLSLLMTIQTEIDAETEMPSDHLTARSIAWFHDAGFEVNVVRDIAPKMDPKLKEKIQSIMDLINAGSAHPSQQIKRWKILPNDFTTKNDELGPMLKVRRWVVEKKYSFAIDSMYRASKV